MINSNITSSNITTLALTAPTDNYLPCCDLRGDLNAVTSAPGVLGCLTSSGLRCHGGLFFPVYMFFPRLSHLFIMQQPLKSTEAQKPCSARCESSQLKPDYPLRLRCINCQQLRMFCPDQNLSNISHLHHRLTAR